ncbi:hypothetical protein ACFVGY_35625 [Streptomyces sp. NPDC127106]|uniref:hypothetical protein n=1 Tax=Streptomyces sp. NPDC127106 TaxID=3345360 RepID=UPI00362ECBD2
MSEIADTSIPAPAPAPTPASPPVAPGVRIVHEAYSFACMRCGFAWEQGYQIEHHTDGRGQPFILYRVEGERVPSPLSNPTCQNCGGHVVRIMRAGQVSSVLGTIDKLWHHRIAPGIAGPVPAGANEPRAAKARHKPPHEGPGPVPVDTELDAEQERRGPLARLLRKLRRS